MYRYATSAMLRSTSRVPLSAKTPFIPFILVQSRRCLSTQKMTAEAAHERLVAQRKNRPISPHIEIYKWEYVSLTSAMHRITGVMLAGGLYTFATLYLVAPALGWHLETAPMVEAFGSLPFSVKTALKLGASFPFTYHGFNGLKHLVYDTGHLMSKINSGRASYVVLVCSVSASLGLALYQF